MSDQTPGLELSIRTDPESCAILKVDDQRTLVTDVDRGDRLPIKRENGCKPQACAGVQLVPFASGVPEQERHLYYQLGVQPVPLVSVQGTEVQPHLLIK